MATVGVSQEHQSLRCTPARQGMASSSGRHANRRLPQDVLRCGVSECRAEDKQGHFERCLWEGETKYPPQEMISHKETGSNQLAIPNSTPICRGYNGQGHCIQYSDSYSHAICRGQREDRERERVEKCMQLANVHRISFLKLSCKAKLRWMGSSHHSIMTSLWSAD